MVLYHTITEFATVSQLSKGLPKHHPTLMSLDNLPLNIFTSPCSELQVKSSTLRLDYDEEGLEMVVKGGVVFPGTGDKPYGRFLGGELQNIETCNSYIHIIDAMLWPCDFGGPRCAALQYALSGQESISSFNSNMKRLNDTRFDLADPALHATVFAFTDVAWRSLLDQNAARNLPSSFQNAFYLNMTQDIARFHMAVEVGDALELPTGPGSTPDNLIFIDQNKNLGMLQTAATRF